MTITLAKNVEQSTIDKILTYLRRQNVPFSFHEEAQDDEADILKTTAIRERLRLKYVVSGEWATMNEDDRQDAALLEAILYNKEQPDYTVYSEADTKSFFNDLKKQLNAV
jgi:hypothetical protein